jgi:hypothetical protein
MLGQLEPVDLALRQDVERDGEVIEYCYFPEDCLISVTTKGGGATVEVGMIGFEGMTALGVVEQDDQTPFDTFVQGAGSAHRVEVAVLRDGLAESAELQTLFLRYTRSFGIQVASTASANARAKLEERLCRWLLMVSDRLGPSFSITHEFLGVMLGVRRSGVTLAVQELEGRGLIRARRGGVSIIDRTGLIEHANGFYGLPEREYERLVGGPVGYAAQL